IHQNHHHLCLTYLFKGASDPNAFHYIFSFPDPCGVDETESHASYRDLIFNGIPGSSCYVTNNSPLFIEEGVQEGGFPDVWFPDNGYGNTILDDVSNGEGIHQALKHVLDLYDQS